MAQGNYDHPSYLTRQVSEFGPTIAGASGTSGQIAFPNTFRFRNATGCVAVAGTIGTNVQSIIQAVGTGIVQYTTTGVVTSTGTIALGTISYGTAGNTLAAQGSSGDMNVTVPAGSVVAIKNGLDATATTNIAIEYYLDPSATWTGVGN